MRSTVTSAAVVLGVVAALPIACRPSESKSAPPADAATLEARIDALKPGDTLKLDNTTYQHSGVIKVRAAGVHIDGNGATLQATNDATSSVQILADDVQLSNITLTAPPNGPRMTGLDQHKLVVAGNHDSISGITITGSAAAGIFVNGAQHFSIKDVRVSRTRADGVHMTAAAGNGVLDNIRTEETGDDGVAVVSYSGDAAPCHDIAETNVTVAGTTWGRGISVVGGSGVTVRGFTVSNTSAAGLYVATEGSPYFTRSVDHVDVGGGSITAANREPTVVHGAILVAAGNPGTSVQGVNISDVSIAATAPTAERNVALVDDAGTVKNVVFRSIRIDTASLPALSGDTSPDSVSAMDWTVGGAPTTVN